MHPLIMRDAHELRGEAHLPTCLDDPLAQTTHDLRKEVGADMRLRLYEDILGRAARDELLQHEASERALGARGQLAIGERPRTTLAELDVRLLIETSAIRERAHIAHALLNGTPALYEEGTKARAC